MSIQFENVKSQLSGIRAWGNLEQDTIVVQVRVSPGLDYRTTKTGKWVFHTGKQISDFVDNSDVGISDIYWKQDGEWLAKFGTIKSMCGLSNREIERLVQRLQENGKFSGDMENSQWENVTIEDGELIFVDDWKDVGPEEFVVEQTPENMEEFDSWLDKIIGIIGEVSEATREQLRKLGTVLDTLGKELEETEEEESVVEMLEDDDEEEKLASEIMETPEEIIETPVKPNESPIANRIMEGVSSKKPEQSWKSHKSFLDKILDEMVTCEPMGWEEVQKAWENTWKDTEKEWQRHAMNRRHKEQEERSKWDLFHGLSGKTPPWPKF